MERVTEQAPRFFVCISEWISSTRESVGFIVYGIRMNILQNNPYRLLGVYSNSPTKERLANHNRMKAFLKVGKSVSFPLDLSQYLASIERTETSVADAEAALTLPKDQMQYAQFWFVKVTPLDEVAFNHLLDGDMDGAIEIWRKKECPSSLQNLFLCFLIKGYLFLALYYAKRLYSNIEYVREFVGYVVNDISLESTVLLIDNLLDKICDHFGAKELLRVYKADRRWSLLDFAREHGKMKVAPFVNKETGDKFKSCAFINAAGEVTLVAFWSKLGELTPTEIAYNKENLDVIQLSSGYYKLVYRETVHGDWRKYIIDKCASKYIADIQNCIELSKKSKGQQAKNRLLAGEQLRKNTAKSLTELSTMLSHTDLQYQMIADKLGLEILQCGIDYYNDSEEPDAARKAMVLQRYAKSIVVGQMAKDRCKENVDILQKIIDNLPPLEVFAEDRAIHKELQKYCSLPDKISYAIELLNNTKPLLQAIKEKLGRNSGYYLKISTLVVSNALSNVIAEVNQAQKDKSEAYLAKVLVSAWKVTLIMDTFDKNEEFKARYLSNKETLFSIYRQIVFSDMVSSEVVAIYEAIDSFNGTTKTIERESDSPFFSNISSYRLPGMDDLARDCQFSKITTLLDRTKGLLGVVKQCSSVSDVDYKKLSTKIVSMALNDVIKLVNNSTSSRVSSYNLKFDSTISSAYLAILKMASFDMTFDFKEHFDEQMRIISQMNNRSNPFMHSVDNKSSTSSGSGCMVMLCAIFGLVVLTIYSLINM